MSEIPFLRPRSGLGEPRQGEDSADLWADSVTRKFYLSKEGEFLRPRPQHFLTQSGKQWARERLKDIPPPIPALPPGPSVVKDALKGMWGRPVTTELSDFGTRTMGEFMQGLRDVPEGGRMVMAPESSLAERGLGVVQTLFGLPRALVSPLTAASQTAYEPIRSGISSLTPTAVKEFPIAEGLTLGELANTLGESAFVTATNPFLLKSFPKFQTSEAVKAAERLRKGGAFKSGPGLPVEDVSAAPPAPVIQPLIEAVPAPRTLDVAKSFRQSIQEAQEVTDRVRLIEKAGLPVPKALRQEQAAALKAVTQPLKAAKTEAATVGSDIAPRPLKATAAQSEGARRLEAKLKAQGVDVDALKAKIAKERGTAPHSAPADLLESSQPSVIGGGGATGAELLVAPRTPEKATGLAANINLDRMNTIEDVKRLTDRMAQEYAPTIEKARRGTVAMQATAEMAQKRGITVDDLLKTHKEWAANPEKALAARDLFNKTMTDFQAVHAEFKAKAGTGILSEADYADFAAKALRTRMVMEATTGITAEAGRTLNIFRMQSDALRATGADRMNKIMSALGGKELTKATMTRLASIDPEDTVTVNRFISSLQTPSKAKMAVEYFYSSILSGPPTHAVNITSNVAFKGLVGGEKGIAGVIDPIRATLTRTPRERFTGEAGADLYGAFMGLKDGVRRGIKAFKDESFAGEVGKVEHLPAIPGTTGRVLRVPLTALKAEDEFARTLAETGELHTLAYRMAKREGLSGDALAKRVSSLVNNPPDHFLPAMRESGTYQTFTEPLTGIFRKLQQAQQSNAAAAFIAPFIKIGVNLAKRGLERFPLTGFPMAITKIVRGQATGGAASTELAKPIMGSLIAAGAALAWAEGLNTGGGSVKPSVRAMERESGRQPYSWHIGDTYIPYHRYDPIGSQIGMVADLMENLDQLPEKKIEEVAKKIVFSISQNLTNKTFLSSMEDFFDFFNDPFGKGEKFLKGLAGAAVPFSGLTGRIAQAIDPTVRETNIVTAPLSKIPFASQLLPERRSALGEVIERPGTGIERILSPSPLSFDRPERELERELAARDIGIGHTSKTITINKRDIALTDQERNFIELESGQRARPRLLGLVKSQRFQQLDKEAQRDEVSRIIGEERRRVRERMRPVVRQRLQGTQP